jgi:hypothetical protein
VVSIGPEGASYRSLKLPTSKEEIENWVLSRALRAADAAGLRPYALAGTPIRNAENDLDFTLPTEAGEDFLDLMEIVILPKGARGHRDGATGYDVENRTMEVFGLVKKKTRRYGRPRSRTHLLLYITDRRFELVPAVVERLALVLSRKPHGFSSVCYFAPDTEEEGLFIQLYPMSANAVGLYEKQDWERKQSTKRTWIMRADLARATFGGTPIAGPKGKS